MAQSVEESNDRGKAFSAGPYGGTEGRAWDDGIYSTVKLIMICHDAFCIRWIRIQYVFAGRLFWSEIHGPTNYNEHIHMVDLDYPDEFLIEMSGRYVKSSWLLPTSLASLTFKSNKKVYGPFGIWNKGHSFSIQVPGSMIVGFHGRYNVWHSLPAIGAHLRPIDDHHNENYHSKSEPASQVPNSTPPTSHNNQFEKDEKANKYKSTNYIKVSGNEIIENTGNQNGNVSVVVCEIYKKKVMKTSSPAQQTTDTSRKTPSHDSHGPLSN